MFSLSFILFPTFLESNIFFGGGGGGVKNGGKKPLFYVFFEFYAISNIFREKKFHMGVKNLKKSRFMFSSYFTI